MAGRLEALRIFVASPSDVTLEREILEGVVKELNDIWATKDVGIILQLIRWETHVYPGFGPYPQAVINEQVGDDYDIFVGVLWTRFEAPLLELNLVQKRSSNALIPDIQPIRTVSELWFTSKSN
jgi:hypothetical protein